MISNKTSSAKHQPRRKPPSPVGEMKQVSELRSIFARFDMDADGSLTLLELAALLRSLGLKPSGEQVRALLADVDANGNGAVEFEELAEAMTVPGLGEEILASHDQLAEAFRSFDRDGNGFITAAELAGAMAKMGQPLTYKQLTDMIAEADSDGDGLISFREFATVMANSASDFLGLALSSSSSSS